MLKMFLILIKPFLINEELIDLLEARWFINSVGVNILENFADLLIYYLQNSELFF